MGIYFFHASKFHIGFKKRKISKRILNKKSMTIPLFKNNTCYKLIQLFLKCYIKICKMLVSSFFPILLVITVVLKGPCTGNVNKFFSTNTLVRASPRQRFNDSFLHQLNQNRFTIVPVFVFWFYILLLIKFYFQIIQTAGSRDQPNIINRHIRLPFISSAYE